MQDPPALDVRYQSWGALQRDCMEQLARQGLFLKIDLDVPQFAKMEVRLTSPDGQRFELAGEVVSVVPGSAVALSLSPASRPALEALLALVAQHPLLDAPPADDPVVSLASADEGESEEGASTPEPTSADQVSLQKQLEDMSVAEKRKLALHGKKDMRLLLIRDHNKSLHPFVIQNPAITLDEVEQIARMTSVNPDVLLTISKNRDWVRSAGVVRNLVKNPKTPMPAALALLEKMPLSDIRALAKSSSVRGPIQATARKKIATA